MGYIYKENGSDWALVADRLEEVVAQLPQKVDAGVELGNAYLRLGRRDEAIGAYQRLLDQDKVPVEEKIAAQLRAQIELARAAPDVASLEPMRNPWPELGRPDPSWERPWPRVPPRGLPWHGANALGQERKVVVGGKRGVMRV